jgi:hypothetical protein
MIKFSCEKVFLQNAIAVTSRAVAQKSSIPALEGLLIHADQQLTISGYNMQTGIRTNVFANVVEGGDIVLNARLFGDIIRRMPDDMITFTADEKMMVHVSCGDADFDILGLSAADYPDLPEVEDEYAVSMQQKVLRSMIEEVAFAVSTNESRPVHTGALFEIADMSLSMVAVDLKDPTQRQTLTEPGLSGLSIGFIDDGAVYCPLTTDTEKCYRVALDLSECTRVAIPREQRPTDYDALLDQIYAAVGAIDNRMALRTLRARYSETGSLTSLEMTVWSLQEETYSLNSWADVHVSVQRSGSGFTVTAQDQHRPLPMDSETVAAMLSVQRFVETVKAVDSADLWTSQKTGQPLYYQLTYHASEYEAAVAADGGVPCLNPDGSAAQLPQGSLLVLAQCYDRGDANIALTDSQGLTTGALRVIVPAA